MVRRQHCPRRNSAEQYVFTLNSALPRTSVPPPPRVTPRLPRRPAAPPWGDEVPPAFAVRKVRHRRGPSPLDGGNGQKAELPGQELRWRGRLHGELGHAGRERPAADEGGFAPRREDRRDEVRRRAALDHAVAARPRLAGKQPPTLPGARGQSRSLGPENVHLAPDKKIGRAHV